MNNTKKIIVGTIISGVVLAGYYAILPDNNLGKEKIFQIDKNLITIKAMIENDRQNNGKYKRQDKKTIHGMEYYIHEYKTSKSEIGYTIFLTKKEDNKIYKKAIATGVEKESREYDWYLFKDNSVVDIIATTTKI